MGTLGCKRKACKRGHVDFPRSKNKACLICRKLYYKENTQAFRDRAIRYAAERAKRNPEARRDEQRAHRMGVPVSVVRHVIARSGMRCESCSVEVTHRHLCVDHDHVTGKIRGVLCFACNTLEGMLNKQPQRVRQIMAYLERYKDSHLEFELERLGVRP